MKLWSRFHKVDKHPMKIILNMKLGVILGDNLFYSHNLQADSYVMIEDVDLCTHYKYHKHKIIFFLSAMREHAKKIQCSYYFLDNRSYEDKLLCEIKDTKADTIVMYTINDKFFNKKIRDFCNAHNITLELKEHQGFLTTQKEFLSAPRSKMQYFYEWQRKRLDILMDGNQPKGGQWSFDHDNRKKLPKNHNPPPLPQLEYSITVSNVKQLVQKKFADHPGSINNFWLPVTRDQSLQWLESFFNERFDLFGPYEDAMASNETFIYHSALSPLLNAGLLTPKEVVKKANDLDVRINSKEGFIRQIIGWREYIKGMYNTHDFNGNFFNNQRKLTKNWYDGTTGIEPVDTVIKRVAKYGYAHHIERLMILGNIMLMSEIHPDEVNKWFMELFVDSADWVMVPNVYGMSQFSDGGSFATKPYIASSNYIRKMSDFKKGEWCEIVDGLFWRFLQKHRDFFKKNYRMNMLLANLDKKDYSNIIKKADQFILEKTL